MKQLYIKLWKWLLWAAYTSGVRQWHARFTAWLFDRKYRDIPVKAYASLNELAFTMSDASYFYRPDSWMRLWDSISYPGRFQHFLDNGGPGNEDSNDCDDFANYIAHALIKSELPNVSNIRLLVVFWMQENNLPNGHAVCLFENGGKLAYMDYGWPTYRDTVEDISKAIMDYYSGTHLLMWAELDPHTFYAKRVVKYNE